MDKVFDHKTKEPEIYSKWENSGAFSPKSSKRPFTILMPPPNANAHLHIGHCTYAIQDLVARYKRMQGYDTLYLSGTDHAGFETQYVYEKHLKKDGKSRFDFDRVTFYNKVLDFVKENSEIAINQFKVLGISADWSKNTFMLDDHVIKTVYDTFLKMYKDGMVYRAGYMVNYSTFYGTTFSDLETEYLDTVSPLYYVSYKIEGTEELISVATVRPETIYADVAIAVNPKDKRYSKFVGKIAINPLNGRKMKIIEDEYVDKKFGTGALKITPGHDLNDFKIGQQNNLEVISLINLDGRMNENAGECAGLFAKQARIKVADILKENGALQKVDEKYTNRVLVDYKDHNPIEPMVLDNWFIDMEKFCDLAIEAIEDEEVTFNQKMWRRDVLKWIVQKKPWPISRQTVFGIRIPAWYSIEENPNLAVTFRTKDNETQIGKIADLLKQFSLQDIKDGLQKIVAPSDAKFVISTELPGDNYLQDTDTFDTWFSSGQWPLTTTGYPDSEIHKNFYPTNFLDSGYDIMFFWIARMIMFSKYLTGKVPFYYVYFHGMVTDKHGVKMSKSKGNAVNPLTIIDKYGADALRMGIVVGGNTASKLTPFDEDKVRGYRNFANKIWNVGRYYQLKTEGLSIPNKFTKEDPTDLDIINKYNSLVDKVTKDLDKYNFKLAGEKLYDFVWNDFANGYLEAIRERNDVNTMAIFRNIYFGCIKLLHPFMPFVTESIWQELKNPEDADLIVSNWPQKNG